MIIGTILDSAHHLLEKKETILQQMVGTDSTKANSSGIHKFDSYIHNNH